MVAGVECRQRRPGRPGGGGSGHRRLCAVDALLLLALRDLPLGRAYSLLSISYALVYLLAASLPLFNEPFTLSKTLGVALVILGVITINSRSAPATSPRNTP